MAAIDGIVSGLDTRALIDALMQVEALPQSALKSKVSSTQSLVSAFQKLNAAVAKIGSVAETTGKTDALEVFTTTSSAGGVTVTAGAGASPGDLEFGVDTTALAHRMVSAPMTEWPESPAVLTFVQNGVTTEVTANSSSFADIAAAVEASGAGVSVARVASGTIGSEPAYRLQFTSTQTGAESSFTVHRGTSAQVTAGTAVDLVAEPGAATVQTARDASITLWAGSTAEQSITSATNTFAGVLPGVDITVSKVEDDPVRVAIGRDVDKAGAVVKSLVGAIAEALAVIQVNSTVTTSPGSNGNSSVRGGLFTGDSTIRNIAQQMRTAAISPVDGRSPSEFGIVLTKAGNVEFDAEKFAKAMQSDPARTAAAVAEISGRLEDAAKLVSDKFEGTLTTRITGQESLLRNLSTQVEDWTGRLESRRAVLERTYTAMEVQLGKLNAQSSWLSSQLGSLSKGSSGANE